MYIYIKRFFDIILSAIIIIIIFPILVFTIIIIKLDSNGPIFFRQRRLGKNGHIFNILKLRTMTHVARRFDIQVFNENPDITRVGSFLRRFKIDELPQLLNVFKGDMSLVGPRPCLPDLIDKFNENGKFRLLVKPGLTGWAQVNGNIYNTWPKRWEFDRYYVENMSFILDLKILVMTVQVVLFGEKK
jgi:undecaprenyl phosphate N,N'-diacetylbacillosamine 1-phosphate transferase